MAQMTSLNGCTASCPCFEGLQQPEWCKGPDVSAWRVVCALTDPAGPSLHADKTTPTVRWSPQDTAPPHVVGANLQHAVCLCGTASCFILNHGMFVPLVLLVHAPQRDVCKRETALAGRWDFLQRWLDVFTVSSLCNQVCTSRGSSINK